MGAPTASGRKNAFGLRKAHSNEIQATRTALSLASAVLTTGKPPPNCADVWRLELREVLVARAAAVWISTNPFATSRPWRAAQQHASVH